MDVASVKNRPVEPAAAPKPAAKAPSQENKPNTEVAKKQPEAKPLPVVNTQGQVTGRHLNVTA